VAAPRALHGKRLHAILRVFGVGFLEENPTARDALEAAK